MADDSMTEVQYVTTQERKDPSVEGQTVRDELNARLHGEGVVPCQTACTHDVAPGWTALGIANAIGRAMERAATAHKVEVHNDDGFIRVLCTECDWYALHDTRVEDGTVKVKA